MNPTTDEASLSSLRTEFLLGADLARLLALNSAMEAARVGRNGESAARAARKTDSTIIGAMASHCDAVSLLSHTLEACRVTPGPAQHQSEPGH